jgi:cytochrome P450/predicted unusual protein kinase regulating ubiquinone biosynthesis (AarF/ABC1/UbiB family)
MWAMTGMYRVLVIAGTVGAALARYEWLRLRGLVGRPPTASDWDRAHDRTAKALHDLGVRLAGLLVKVCQVVGARTDVFPEPFVRRLGRFHDRVPPRAFESLRGVIEDGLGCAVEDVFVHVDPTPLAAASLAQVHRARCKDGREVVLKVRYPEIARLARIDLSALRTALKVVARVEPRIDLRSVVEEIAEFVALELDFAREADSTERVRAAFADDPSVRIPVVDRDLSGGGLLVLEYLPGIKITDLERLEAAGVDLRAVARHVARIYARMIFDDGFFQGDPHPGNLLVMPGGVIGVLDFGLAKELPPRFGDAVARLLVSALSGDVPGAEAAAREAGFVVPDGDPAAIPGLVLALLGDREQRLELSDLLSMGSVERIPSHFALIARVMLLLNGLSHTLAPGELLVQQTLIEHIAERGAEGAAVAVPDGLPPGPETAPLLQALRWARWPITFLDECRGRFGETFTVRLPGSPPLVLFSHPDAIKDIFTGSEDDLRAGEANVRLEPLLGSSSVLLLDGDEHMRERRLLLPPFHGERMHAYGEAMRDIADRAIDSWPVGEAFPIHGRMQAITLDVILRTVFGMDEGVALERLRAQLTELLSLAANPLALLGGLRVSQNPRALGSRVQGLRAAVDEALYAQIARRRALGTDGRSDVLSLLVDARDEDGEPMSDRALRDELVTLLVAGHETTATSLAWATSRLLAHPEVADRLRAELAEAAAEGRTSPADVARLPYLDATAKESMRLDPVVPMVGRRLARPLVIGGVSLPAGVVASPCIYLAHRRPERWPEPEAFRPERFLETRPTPYEFLPFGGGVRRCIGAAFALYEMKLVLAQVLQRVDLQAAPGYRVRVVRRAVTLAPSEGMPVVVEERRAA